jgi:Na+-driven multidrug efflux pump
MRNCKAKVPRRLSNVIGSLGMQDSMGPLKSLAIASTVNLAGDIFLCTVMGYGIAGAAWATMASQVCHSVVLQYSIDHTLKFQSIFFEVFFLP